MGISRRDALLSTMAGGLVGCAGTPKRASFSALAPSGNDAFAHGVASGDPQAESVVLWTRVNAPSLPVVPVMVEVAEDRDFARIVKTYRTEALKARDHTVKVVADGLTPGGTYYYRFTAGERVSPVGRTKTLPEQADSVRFAVASCSNYPFGYFNAYDHIARRDDLDVVIHLGDYIYEYGPGGYGDEVGQRLGRAHLPAKEITSLEDYRGRHAQYKSDPSTQAMHAAHPFIAIWDDHETANNSWEEGAENHDPGEGTWEDRKRAALQAYYEWMPVRDPEPGKTREALYKSYKWGGLLTLSTIETRLMARTQQIEYADVVPTLKTQEDIERFRRETLADPAREMMGPAQMEEVVAAIGRSASAGEPWRVIANQVIMARMIAPDLGPYLDEETIAEIETQWSGVRAFIAFAKLGLPMNMDAWDGYPAARQRFYDAVSGVGARDLIVLTGDTHQAWANDLYDDNGQKMGIELGATGITSPGPTNYLGDKAFDFSLLVRKENRDIRFNDPLHNGYFTLALTPDEGAAEFVAVSTVLEPAYSAETVAAMDIVKQDGSIAFRNPRGLGFKERMVFKA